MTNSKQSHIFLDGEGDAWYSRNYIQTAETLNQWASHDPLAILLSSLPLPSTPEINVLEVGCGQGLRLSYLKESRGWSVYGLDPSAQAISELLKRDIDAKVGTADYLPFNNNSIDLLVFGFCLYLCDRNDLFRIASEAHRVLKPQSWLAILDFWSPSPKASIYRHADGIYSYKDNLPSMFSWHPSYSITDHSVRHHVNMNYTDDPSEWVSATVIRRNDLHNYQS